MTESADTAFLASLGWSDFFASQIEPHETDLIPRRIAEVHRARLSGISAAGPVRLGLAHKINTADFAVGDWVLADPRTHLLIRRLDRRTVLQRRTEGRHVQQLAAANVDTLFIVTSCNADFSPARLERYLALANQAGTNPVIVLTKADTIDDASAFEQEARGLQRGLEVVALNGRSADAAGALTPWCGTGQTVALVGSSGVGKSTLVNTLAGLSHEAAQQTGEIRESDAKGRHTTTSRSLHAIAGGGWVIDTPGMRTLHVSDASDGIDTLFSEITDLAPLCRFRDCTHDHEPGCAVQAAVTAGTLDADRLARWRKLLDENVSNTPVQTGPRGNKISQKKKY
ncbi:ribosome small subunit-dependent GTPase A [Rhizobium herbae]|uniref:Small ribosomal subunit biogenesis GTPase RsgA n=1 Tax=Rhizobium herbae TaxID=508661 RepID=A0ABS4EN19_9HYPH|nr:ribosome small subunit-dependent GTPase A [Rhizobium herbae]MBP1859320.1 ribosome biogenesis GTPase [Rhizobium herbae]